jgi:ABC-type multidrug transport system fused ATPase/permease subunit
MSLLLLFINSLVELVGLAAMLPLFSIMLSENFIEKSKYLKSVYEQFHFQSEMSFIVFLCGSLLGLIVFKNILGILVVRYHAQFSFSLYTYFSTGLQKYFYKLPYLDFKKVNSSFLVNYVNNHPSFFAQYFVLPLLTFLNEVIVVVLVLVTVTIYDPQVVILLFLTVFPLSAATFYLIRRKIDGIGLVKSELGAELQKTIHQSIEGYVDVKTLLKEKYFFGLYKNLVVKNDRLSVKSATWMAFPSRVIELGMVLGIICMILFGVYFGRDRSHLSTLLGVFAIAAYRILPSINRIMAAVLMMKEHQYTTEIISNVTPESVNEEDQHGFVSHLSFQNIISVKDIAFNYPGREKILDGITFDIAKGERVGIIGRSGSGKTTLMNIMLRFLEETEGAIEIDGQKIGKHNQLSWRAMFGYVQQNVFVIDGTVAENVAFGVPPSEINYDKVSEALEAASLSEMVSGFAKGMHSPLGERGSSLSGGQRQRIGIARALYSNAKVLLFDEATSALDDETERAITDSIQKLSGQHLTIVIVAHRYSTLRYCDKIIELESGRISGVLKYDDLAGRMMNIRK